jgi:hypothetical protein
MKHMRTTINIAGFIVSLTAFALMLISIQFPTAIYEGSMHFIYALAAIILILSCANMRVARSVKMFLTAAVVLLPISSVLQHLARHLHQHLATQYGVAALH